MHIAEKNPKPFMVVNKFLWCTVFFKYGLTQIP